MMRGVTRVKRQSLFLTVEMSKIGGQAFKGRGAKFNRDTWGVFLAQIAVGGWKVLPAVLVDADKIVAFGRFYIGIDCADIGRLQIMYRQMRLV